MVTLRRMVVGVAMVMALAMIPLASVAQEKIEGKVLRTNLTACNPKPTGGGCEGSLTVEIKADGETQQVPIKVVAATLIRKGKDYLFLPATQGNSVVVSYVTEQGQKMATSIDIVETKR